MLAFGDHGRIVLEGRVLNPEFSSEFLISAPLEDTLILGLFALPNAAGWMRTWAEAYWRCGTEKRGATTKLRALREPHATTG